jgi:phage tail tube protein FII
MKTLLIIISLGLASLGYSQTTNDYSKDTLKCSGFASPDSALETWVWATIKGDKAELLKTLTPEARKEWEEMWAGATDEQMKSEAAKRAAKLTGYTIQKREVISADEVVVHFLVNGTDLMKMDVKKLGNDWKIAGPKKD